MFFWTGGIKDNNLLLNIKIDSEFLMLSSKLSKTSEIHEQIKRITETIFSTVVG